MGAAAATAFGFCNKTEVVNRARPRAWHATQKAAQRGGKVNLVERQGKKPYQSPSLRKLSIQQARKFMMNHARELLQLIYPGWRKNCDVSESQARIYRAPRLIKLTPEQAKLRLLGHLSVGDCGARDLLDLLFPDPGSDQATVTTAHEDSAAESSWRATG